MRLKKQIVCQLLVEFTPIVHLGRKKKRMYRYLFILTLLLITFGCKTTSEFEQKNDFEYVDNGNAAYGAVTGRLIDPDTKEPLPYANVMLKGTTFGVVSDLEGVFILKNIPPGSYDLWIEHLGYKPSSIGIEIMAGKTLQINSDIPLETQEIMLEKPMIYLYPEVSMDVEVSLDYKGELTSTYPKSNGNWSVHAEPDGTLTDAAGRNYYGLYWEGIPATSIVPDCGTVVGKDSLISFLEASLTQLGLNFKEANEFIVYWLPRLEQSDFNLIYFAQEDYSDQAVLNIAPKPDHLIRVMMCFTPLKKPIEITPQILPEQPDRNGFTVVEWGGTKCSLPQL